MDELTAQIRKLKEEKAAVILAHYYTRPEVQAIADYTGDSFYLAKMAKADKRNTVLFCGVTFMAEAAKILCPDKTIVYPAPDAVCPMALMVDEKVVQDMRKKYDDLAVVCYINSTARIKALSDICVTSSNAERIVRGLKQKNIFFIPDQNLGRFLSERIPEKNIVLNDGYCHIHAGISVQTILHLLAEHPGAAVLAHPECSQEVTDSADFVGSTKDIIEEAGRNPGSDFIVCTESGVLYELQKRYPDKHFFFAGQNLTCPNMKKITLERIAQSLETLSPQAEVSEELAQQAWKPLERMLEA